MVPAQSADLRLISDFGADRRPLGWGFRFTLPLEPAPQVPPE